MKNCTWCWNNQTWGNTCYWNTIIINFFS
jgi:hypothetical protein